MEEAVAQLSLDKSSESVSTFSRASSSIVDVDEKDRGTEKELSSDGSLGSSLHGELVTIDESTANVERRKSASQGSESIRVYVFLDRAILRRAYSETRRGLSLDGNVFLSRFLLIQSRRCIYLSV